MSDRFDPDAWPLPEEDDPAKKQGQSDFGNDSDDYKSLDFDNPSGSGGRGDYGDPYSDAPYSDAGYSDDQFGFDRGRDGGQDNGFSYNSGDYDNDLGQRTDSAGWSAPGASGGYDDDRPDGNRFDNDYNDGDFDRRNDGYDDGYDDYGDDDYDDDDYDNSDDNKSGGLLRKLLAAAVVLLFLVAIGAGIIALTNRGSGDDIAGPGGQVDQTTETTEDTTGEDTVNPQTAPLPADVKAGIDAALVGWGRFATTGNLEEVRPYFVTDGTQFQRFESESRSLQDAPPGGQPLTMTASNESAQQAGSDWIVQADVLVSRQNEQDQAFRWEMRVVRAQDTWQISSIRQLG